LAILLLAAVGAALAIHLGLIRLERGRTRTPEPSPAPSQTTKPGGTQVPTKGPGGGKPPKPSPTPTEGPRSGGDLESAISAIPHIYRKPQNWNGKAIVFVHGLGGRKETWEGDMDAFEGLGYAVFAFDLPYHGERGTFPGAEVLPDLIRQGASEIALIAEYLRAQGAEEVYLISRSLGSIVSAVALGSGAEIDKAELLLASADLRYVFTYGQVEARPSWLDDDSVLREIDPLYLLPDYEGRVHFHCGLQDSLLTPEACAKAYNAAILAAERRIIWHDRGHSMPLEEYFDDAKDFFASDAPPELKKTLVNVLGVKIPSEGGDGVCGPGETWENSPFDCPRPVLIVAFQLHIEENPGRPTYYDQDRATFEWYAEVLDRLASTFEAHGAKLSIQTEKNFARADVQFGRHILRDLVARGHGVGVQSHMGHHMKELGLTTDAQKLAYTREVKEAVSRALGSEPTNLGGGFEMDNVCLLGAVKGGLWFTSMTAVEKPYHQRTRKAPAWLHPWILPPTQMIDLSDPRWLAHDDSGGLVYIPGWFWNSGDFEVDCRSGGGCFEAATESLEAALESVDERFVNVWWVSSHLYQTGASEEEVERVLQAYDRWLTEVVDPLVRQGRVVWMTFDEVAQLYLRWEAERLRYISSRLSSTKAGPEVISLELEGWANGQGSRLNESEGLLELLQPPQLIGLTERSGPRFLDLPQGIFRVESLRRGAWHDLR